MGRERNMKQAAEQKTRGRTFQKSSPDNQGIEMGERDDM